MKEYKIVTHIGTDGEGGLSDKVNDALLDGWQLQGGVGVAVDDNYIYYVQALWRKRDD